MRVLVAFEPVTLGPDEQRAVTLSVVQEQFSWPMHTSGSWPSQELEVGPSSSEAQGCVARFLVEGARSRLLGFPRRRASAR